MFFVVDFFILLIILQYLNYAEEVLEEIRKEEESLKERVIEENFGTFCSSSRKKIWNLMEKPESSKAARVS